MAILPAVFAALAWCRVASAHFTLINPPSWVVEDGLGNPQKIAPCGGDDVDESGDITTYRAGSTISVEWQETVGHPGHFRISLATDRAQLVDPPVQTTGGDGMTGMSISAEIENNPKLPVLIDGLFPRVGNPAASDEPFKVPVQLPNMTCEKCTLQVIQFMANHLPNYFYHHCADVKIVAADAQLAEEPPGVLAAGAQGPTGPSGSATQSTGAGAGTSNPDASEGGCSLMSVPAGALHTSASLFLVGIAAALRRRRVA
jgi:hypothetical protein